MLQKEQIKEIIPHRDPFLLIDCIEELEIGERATGYWDIREDNPVFQGHFPGNPVLPGVLMLESMAQLGAAIILSVEEFKGKTAYFGGMKSVRFRHMVRPGDRLSLQVEITNRKGSVGMGKARCKVGDKVAATAEFTFAVAED